MQNRMSFLLGIGLVALWIAGLGAVDSRPWLTWLDGLAAICAFFLTATTADTQIRVGAPLLIAGGLFLLWIVGIITPGSVWQAWWTFAFGCGFVLMGVSSAKRLQSSTPMPDEAEEEEAKAARREKTSRSA